MGGGASKTNNNNQDNNQQDPAVDPISQLSPQYVITGGIIRLRGDVEKDKNRQNEVQVIQSDFPKKKALDETKESVVGMGHNEEPVVEDIDDAGSIVGGIPS